MKLISKNDDFFPKKLSNIPNPPKQIYVAGNESVLNKDAIAIVGSRHCTDYGKSIAEKFAIELSSNGLNIISGLALGIDTCAHKGCLKADGTTVAVLGGGLNNIYPEQNEYLFYEIINKGGAVISEYPPETEAFSDGFRRRNRIVSGLSLGVLIIEAAINSGTMITARHAMEQGKKIFCIPGRLDSNKGEGTNELIKKGAKMVTCVEDILEELDVQLDGDRANLKEIIIKEEYKQIYNLLLEDDLTPNEICKITGKAISEINSKLLLMEMEGLVSKKPGNIYEVLK